MFQSGKRAVSLLAALLAVVPAACMVGCGGSVPPTKKAEQAKKPAAVAAASLPKLGGYLPPLDDGRLEAAPPAGWHIPPRSSKYLFRAQRSNSNMYPCLLATAEDFDQFAYLTEDNIGQFARGRAADVNKDPDQVKPVQIGGFLGITYAKRAKVKGSVSQIVELQYLETVIDGRLYRIELRAESGTLTQAQPYLYAVAEGLRFPKAQRPSPEQVARADDSVQPPAGDANEPRPPAAERAEPQAGAPPEPATAAGETPQEKPKTEAEKKSEKEPPPKKKDSGLDLDELEDLLGNP